jgi:small subunit ribosomal protein S7
VPRRGVVKKREVLPDPLYQSPLATRFINALMRDGKKTTAQGIFYGAMDVIRAKTNDDPLKVFKKAVDNVKPVLEVKSRRVGGATYQVPVEVPHERRLSLSIRWLIGFSQARGEKTMREKLANEFMDASNYQGGSIRKKDDTHRMAEANKAFAHYRW